MSANPEKTPQPPEGARVPDLVAAAKEGDREALASLFQIHEPMMLRWARRRLGIPLRTLDETRDILHDAYQVVLRKIGSFRMEDSRSFARWLRGIITRIVLQRSGSPHVRRRDPGTATLEAADLSMTPSTRLGLEELQEHRYRILRNLPRGDRLVYRLRARGWSSSEIAARLGVSDRVVRTRFARTEARLRARLQELLDGGREA